jgi:hypothetical protein
MEVEELIIQSALANWTLTITRLNKFFGALSPEDFLEPVAPGKNRIVYILGHLAAVHDRALEILGLSSRLHPQLEATFLTNPDRAIEFVPDGAVLLALWNEINKHLYDGMLTLAPAQWVGRHQAVSEDDFKKDPTRTRLSVLLNRTNHAGYHLGQLMLSGKLKS